MSWFWLNISLDVEPLWWQLHYAELWFCRQKVSGVQLAVVVVIRSAGWLLQDVLQVVRRWVWWRNVIDGEWAQRWALWRLWLAEIGRQLYVSTFLTGRHYSLLWFSGVLSHNLAS